MEEGGERRETPNEGNPVCRFWRGQQRDWAIAVVCLKSITFFQDGNTLHVNVYNLKIHSNMYRTQLYYTVRLCGVQKIKTLTLWGSFAKQILQVRLKKGP